MMMRMATPLAMLAAVTAGAQTPPFDVASVKPNRTGQSPQTYPRLQNGAFTAENAALKTLLVVAYGIIDLRVNGPAWLDTEKYDIAAKAPPGVPDSQLMPLLQSLL